MDKTHLASVDALQAAIEAGIVTPTNAMAYLDAEINGKYRKSAVRLLVVLVDTALQVSAPDITVEAAEKQISDLKRQLDAAEAKVVRRDTRIAALTQERDGLLADHSQLQTDHDKLLGELEEAHAQAETAAAVPLTKVGSLTSREGHFVLMSLDTLERWRKAPQGRSGYLVDVMGSDPAATWRAAQRYAPGTILRLSDGTLRVPCNTLQEAQVVANVVAQSAKAEGTALRAVLREKSAPLTTAIDRARGNGFGVAYGIAVLSTGMIELSVDDKSAETVTVVQLRT